MSTATYATDATIVDLTTRVTAAPAARFGDAASEALWARRGNDALAERRHAHEAFQRKVATAQRELDQDLDRVTKKEDALTAMRGQTAVFVRRHNGAPVTVYHSVTGSCGWLGLRSNYNERFESEVTHLRLHRCSACIWPT